MTRLTPSPYAHILNWVAEGHHPQRFDPTDGSWDDQHQRQTLTQIATERHPPEAYRLAPVTIRVNGIEVPEPLRVPPKSNVKVFEVRLARKPTASYYKPVPIWRERLRLGLLHDNYEAAVTHREALLAPTEMP